MWFGLLGPLQVQVDGREFHVPAAKQRVLLAALLLAPGQPVSTARLTELLWDGLPPGGSAVTLRGYVKRLRRVLGPAGSRILTASSGYAIQAAERELDLTQFLGLRGEAEAAMRSRAWQRSADLLDQALSLWRGNPLADIQCREIELTEVPRLEELRLDAIQWRIESCLQLGHWHSVVPELRAMIAQHPLREPFYCQLMVALYRGGRQADALAAYSDARRILVDEIGIEPGPELRKLHQQILAGEAESTVGAGGAAVPAMRQPVGLRQLPPRISHFVGRATELRQLNCLLSGRTGLRGGTTIAVIGGMAGVGKTTLALHWTHSVAGSFPDGQLFLNLNGFGPAGAPMTHMEAVSRLLEAMQVPPASVPSTMEGRIGLYRTLVCERRLLLVLDNAKDADQVRPLLPGSGGCFVVVTSRAALAGLVALEDAHAITLTVLSESDARQMVVQRIGAMRAAADSAATDQLIGACGRLPLALAIAAALVATRAGHSLAAMVAELTKAGDPLGALNAGEPMTNLSAVFNWSYQALTPRAARLFRLLAEHPGPEISSAAAASLGGMTPAQTREALGELAGTHLVNAHVADRFAVHDLLRLYAAEKLRILDWPADVRAAGLRMLDHYLHTAWAAAKVISPARELPDLNPATDGVLPEDLIDEAQANGWLNAERQMLMRAIPYAYAAGFDRHAWQLSLAMTDFLDRSGHWHEWADSQRIALAAAQRLGDTAAEAHACRYLGRASFQLQQFDKALGYLSRTRTLRQQLADPAGEAGVCLDLCRVHEQRGGLDDALHCAELALFLYRSAGHLVGEAFALNAVGFSHARLQHYSQALDYSSQALKLGQRLGHKAAQGQAWDSLGFAQQHSGQIAQAVGSYGHALDILREIGDRYLETITLTHLGDAHEATGDIAAACRAWRSAHAILTDLKHPDAEKVRTKIVAAAGAIRSGG